MTTLLILLFLTASPERLANETLRLRLTSPLDYQVYQRTTATNGTIIAAGELSDVVSGKGSVEVRLMGANQTEPWHKLADLAPGQKSFRSELNAPAGGWFRLEVRINQGDILSETTLVPHVGVGELFVVAGQSNSANHGAEKQRTGSELVATFSGTAWALANDPQPGASGNAGSFLPPFGDAMAARFQVPVGFVAAGVGATSVREWLPQGSRFPNPPTLTGEVTQVASGEWESKGNLFRALTTRLKQLGPHGFRALLWHQGESDANQRDASRTLPGTLYQAYLARLIHEAQREVGWAFPWFVAQASYHTPDDPGSSDIRAAQQALWQSGIAEQGPDTDALVGQLRENNGQGVHFSGPGLREHAARWVDKVAPWLEAQLRSDLAPPMKPKVSSSKAPGKLELPGERFLVDDRPAFIFMPTEVLRTKPQPWIFYAPTLPAYPDEAERWMHEQFLAAGIAVAGIDVGEAYGSPKSHPQFEALYRELINHRGFAAKPCLLGRSRGGLWTSSWAIANPTRVAGLAGIYPVFDFATYPGITNAAPAYGLSPNKLVQRAGALNPIERIEEIARTGVPAFLIHGDQDKVVPLKENSAEFVRRYQKGGAGALVELVVLSGQGHSFYEGFFHSQGLVDFCICRARDGAKSEK